MRPTRPVAQRCLPGFGALTCPPWLSPRSLLTSYPTMSIETLFLVPLNTQARSSGIFLGVFKHKKAHSDNIPRELIFLSPLSVGGLVLPCFASSVSHLQVDSRMLVSPSSST